MPPGPSPTEPTPAVPAAPVAPPAAPPTPPPPPPAAAQNSPDSEEDSGGTPWFTGTRRRLGQYHEIGAFIGNTGSLGLSGRSSQSPQMGLRFMEHHGLITKFSVGLLAALGTSGDRVETGRTVERQGDYEVTTVYSRRKTDAEREADAAVVAGALSGEYVTELVLYTDGLFGSGAGKADRVRGGDFYLGGNFAGPFVLDLPSIFDIGVVYSYNHASNVLFDDGHRANVEFVNFGLMVRYQVPVTALLEVLAQVDLNVYGLLTSKKDNTVRGTPLRLGAYLNLTDRVYARPMITYTTGTSGLGKVLEAGIRF